MKLITSISQIDPTLDKPGFWTLEKLQIVDAIHIAAGSAKKVNLSLLDKLNRHIAKRLNGLIKEAGSSSLVPRQKMTVNEVLECLQDHGWHVVFYPLPIKQLRPSSLPNEARDLIYWRSIENWRRWFWEARVGQLEQKDTTLALVLELNSSLGVNIRTLKRAMQAVNLTSAVDETIAIPILDEEESPVLNLPLSSRFRLLWGWYLRNAPEPITTWNSQITQLPQLLKEVPLDTQWQSIPKNQKKRWAGRMLRSGSFSLVEKGIEPFIATALQADTLPLSPPRGDNCFSFYPTDQNWPRLIQRSRLISIQTQLPGDEEPKLYKEALETNTQPSLPAPPEKLQDDEFSIDGELVERVAWLPACQQMTRRLQASLRKACIEPSGHFRNQKLDVPTVDEILKPIRSSCFEWLHWHISELSEQDKFKESLREFVSLLEQQFTGLDLMIAWTRYRLIDQHISVQTLNQDLRLVFARGLFWYECSANLRCWDDEDVEILVSDHLLPSNKNPGAQRRAINLLKRVADWAREQHNCFEEVFFPSTTTKGVPLTWRNHIIGLQEHDLLQRQLKANNTAHYEQVKAVLDLAFYAGMRSGEIANLRLGNVVAGEKELVLYLPAFKTPSAYRSIHFHLLAPPAAVQRVKRALESREIDYRRYARKAKGIPSLLSRQQTLLFSLDRKVEHSSASELVAYTREVMKYWLGDGADLHLARHSFASHLLLRWYCSRYPELIDKLREQKHFLFSPQGLRNLRRHFGEPSNPEQAIYEVASLIHLIKIMGHKTTHTLFSVYVHSFEVIASHALKRVHDIDDSVELSGAAISALVPSTKSRTTQARLNNRSIKSMVLRALDSL